MKIVKIIPDGWECFIEDCPPGHFMYENQLCFKSEYGSDENPDCPMQVYCSSGEYFMPRKIMVQPVSVQIEEE